MKKFQEGGVYDVQPLVPGVSPIPNLPNIEYPEMSAADFSSILSLQDDQDTRIKRQQDRILQEQNQLDKAQSVYYNLKDGLFGDYHSEYQGEVITGAKKKYGVTDDLVNSDNLFTLKDQTNNLYKATTDPEVLRVFGEVEYANKIREGLPAQMTPEQKDAFATEWQNYLNFRPSPGNTRYDMTKLALAATNTPAKKASDVGHFFGATQAVAKGLANIDLTDPAQQDIALKAIGNAWALQDYDDAKAQKLITIDTAGVPTLTPAGEIIALQQLQAATLGATTSQQAKVELDAAKKTNTKTINPPKTEKDKTPEEKKLDQVKQGWEVVLSVAEREGVLDQIKDIDPYQVEWLKAELIKLMATDGGAQIKSVDWAVQWMPKLMKLAKGAPASADTFKQYGMEIKAPTAGQPNTTQTQQTTPQVRDAPSQGGFKKHTGIQ